MVAQWISKRLFPKINIEKSVIRVFRAWLSTSFTIGFLPCWGEWPWGREMTVGWYLGSNYSDLTTSFHTKGSWDSGKSPAISGKSDGWWTIMIWPDDMRTVMTMGWILYTPWKFNSSHLKKGFFTKGKDRLPSMIFQGRTVKQVGFGHRDESNDISWCVHVGKRK